MKRLVTLVPFILVFVLVGCGNGQTGQNLSITDFNRIEISNGFHVDIVVGEEYSVALKVPEEIFDDVEAIKEGNTLKIRTKPLHDIGGSASLNAEVAMPELRWLKLQNGSHVNVKGSGIDVTFDISGGSHADLDDFAVENADLSVTSGSHVTVNVSGKLDAKVKGGSHVRYSGEPQLGYVDLSGGSTFQKQ